MACKWHMACVSSVLLKLVFSYTCLLKIMAIQGNKSFVKILVIKLSYMQVGFAQAAEPRCQIQSLACGSRGCQREQPVLVSKSFNIKLQVTIFLKPEKFKH